MSSSVFCIEQRQLQSRRTRQWLVYGLLGSIAAHGGIALALGHEKEKPIVTEDAIELIIVEEPPKNPEKPRVVPPTPRPVVKQSPKPVPSPKAIPTPEPRPKSVQPVRPVRPVQPRPVTPPARVEARIQPPKPIEPSIVPPMPPPKAIEPSIAPPIPAPEPIAPSIARKPIVTATRPTAPPLPTSEAVAPSAPPAVNRNTRAIENTAPRARESLKAGLDNPATPARTAAANPAAVAPSAPPAVNRNTRAIEAADSENRQQLRSSFGDSPAPSRSTSGASASTAVAANRGVPARPTPKPSPAARTTEGIRCIANCQPSYPSVLNGVEGRAAVRVTVDPGGNVAGVTLVGSGGSGQIDREALLAARKMRFSAPPDGNTGQVQITINFAVAGSEFDRQARERREQQEQVRLAREREKKERQTQLERERQERQRQLQEEQRERQAQLEKERRERERQLQLERSIPPARPSPSPTEAPAENTETTNETGE